MITRITIEGEGADHQLLRQEMNLRAEAIIATYGGIVGAQDYSPYVGLSEHPHGYRGKLIVYLEGSGR